MSFDFSYTNNHISKVQATTNLYVCFEYNTNGLLSSTSRHIDDTINGYTYLYNNEGYLTNRVNTLGTSFDYSYTKYNGQTMGSELAVNDYYWKHNIKYMNAKVRDVVYQLRGTNQYFIYSCYRQH